MSRQIVVLLAAMAVGLTLGSGAALSAPIAPSDAGEDATIEPHVIGGSPVPNGRLRYVAAVRIKSRPQSPYCGGTLIDGDSVLTAAHCTRGLRPGQLRVFLGRADMTSNTGVVRDVARIFNHPYYRPATILHDAAVLKLRSPITNIPRIRLAPVGSGNRLEVGGSYATVAGWGSTIPRSISQGQCVNGDRFSYPSRMRAARVRVARDPYARYIYNSFLPSYGYRCDFYEPYDMVAAGYEGKTTCQGDSGGPLIKSVRQRGKWVPYQIGITSWGAGCGQNGYPAVYAEVNSRHIAPFIRAAATR